MPKLFTAILLLFTVRLLLSIR